MMNQIFGHFIERREKNCEYLKISFSPTSLPIQRRWRNNGLSADFLADYLSSFLPYEDATVTLHLAEIKGVVGYLANELLENAMKFSYAPEQYAISIAMYLDHHAISLYVTNSVDPQALKDFQHFIARLLSEDTAKLYIEQLMRDAQNDEGSVSGLGFLTMMNDYGASLAWKFEPLDHDPDVITVTTMVHVHV